MPSTETAVLILAAGASSRLGRPKQRLLFQEQTLLDRIIKTADALQSGPVLVVVRANENWVLPSNVMQVRNENAQEGMASSIHAGLKKLEEHFPAIETVIITVCDQPFITVALLQDLISQYQQTLLPIIACTYGDSIGTPVLFHKTMFPDLLSLHGDKGARQLIKQHVQRVGLVNFPLGNIDVDTEEDYERLIKQ